MGFYLHCAVARIDDDELATRVLERAREIPHVGTARLTGPWRGVVVAFDPEELTDRILDEPAAFGFADEEAARNGRYDLIEIMFDPLFAAFPDQQFAYIEADCFGGTCTYRGNTVGPGERVHASGSDAHQKLLAAIGVVDPPWFFAPFTREFFETGRVPDEPQRRPVVCSISGVVTGISMPAATIAANMLPAPWKITIANATTAIVVRADDLVVSLNATTDDVIDLRASSHVALEQTCAWVDELVDAICASAELHAKDADGRPLRSWRAG